MNFAKQHFTRRSGHTISAEAEIYRVEYGMLRDVFADRACNYSYREFWF